MRGNSASDLHASRGVILCAGAIATPTILVRSGVGPREEFARHQIDRRVEHPAVGQGLQDHLIMPVIFQTRSAQPFASRPSVRDLARWQVLGGGPIASNLAESGGLFHQDSIQVHLTPTHYLSYPKDVAPVMTVGVNVTRPKSRGSIRLASARYDDPPVIDAGYLSHESDLTGTIQGVRLARSLAAHTDLSDWVTAEILPGPRRTSDASIAKSIARYAQTLYHPVGTCRLGNARDAVVDAGFAVHRTRQLWVVDASVLPTLTLGNPNATVLALASMAAERIAE
jgi:choline dehydrogenase